MTSGSYRELFSARMMHGMQCIQQITVGIDGSETRFFGYVADNSEEMEPDRIRPAILILSGGGYVMTSDREVEPMALQFLAKGFAVFVLRYSAQPSRYPVALLEATEAMCLIRANADQWHISPAQVAILDFPAGGHLAANLATSVGDEDIREQGGMDPDAARPNALVLSYPVITTGKYVHRGSFQCLLGNQVHNQALLDKFFIEKHIGAKTPPVFVWHIMTDDAVPVENTLMPIQACRAADVSIEAYLFPKGSHGLSLANVETAGNGFYAHIVEYVQCWPDLAGAWLRRLFQAERYYAVRQVRHVVME